MAQCGEGFQTEKKVDDRPLQPCTRLRLQIGNGGGGVPGDGGGRPGPKGHRRH